VSVRVTWRHARLLADWPDGWDRYMTEDEADEFPADALLVRGRGERRMFRLSALGREMRERSLRALQRLDATITTTSCPLTDGTAPNAGA
jgi:hypothetical protein